MYFYHGSRDGNINELTTEHSKDGYVYVTNSRLVALTYIGSVFPNQFTTNKNGTEIFIEIIPNFFENTVKGKMGYLYTIETKDNLEPVSQSNRCGHANCFRIKENLKISNVEYIDVYEELQKYIKSGEFKVIKFDEIPKEKIKKEQEDLVKFAIENDNRIKRDNCAHMIVDYLNQSLNKEI